MAKQGMKRPQIEDRKNEAPIYESNDLAIENLREDFDLTDADVQELER